MNPTCTQRITKELSDFLKDSKGAGLKVAVVDKDVFHWKGYLNGPDDTVYQGGVYQVDITFPPEYPYKPPKMKFDTKIWHPNISSQTGAICLDILKKEWSPALTVRTALLSLQALLCCPEPDDPQDAVVATQFKSNPQLFKATARDWVKKYASPQIMEEKIVRLTEMGFARELVIKALEKHGFEEERALEELIV